MAELSMSTIPASGSLDQITAFWLNFDPGKGAATIICWGSAWTCCFGAMSGETIQELFCTAGADYLVNKLGISQVLKQSKANDDYLRRIVEAVQQHMRSEKTNVVEIS